MTSTPATPTRYGDRGRHGQTPPDLTVELVRERQRNAMLVTALRNHRREIDRLTRLLNQGK